MNMSSIRHFAPRSRATETKLRLLCVDMGVLLLPNVSRHAAGVHTVGPPVLR